jgi:phytoene/squalene synthetase
MNLSQSFKYCRAFKYHGMQYPVLISRLLGAPKRDAVAACFASFRIIADEINQILKRKAASEKVENAANHALDRWITLIADSRAGKTNEHSIYPALAETFAKFDLPLEPWDNYRKALKYHLSHDYIPDLKTFQEYKHWAYESTVYTYLHILASTPEEENCHLRINPGLISSDLAGLIFTADVLADIKYDLGSVTGGFVYLPQDLLIKYGFDRESLARMVQSNRSTADFRRLLNEFYLRGREYEIFTREKLVIIRGGIGREEWFALDLLVNIFSRFLHRIWEFPEAIFGDGYPLDPAMVYINALKLQKDLGLSFKEDIARLLFESTN